MNVPRQPAAAGQAPDTAGTPDSTGTSPVTEDPRADRLRVDRLRRGFERLRSASDSYTEGVLSNDEKDLELTLLLLREENARLKAERHRPPDVGTMIEQLRRIAAEQRDEVLSDNAWSLLTECLVIREELDQVCTEIKAAIDAVQTRLGKLQMVLQDGESYATPAPVPPSRSQ